MKLYKIVFSPTGGTDKAADILAEALGGEVETVDLSRADFSGCSVEADSVAVIALPSFGGRAPKTAVDRLKLVHGNGARAVAMAVYGNREQEDTLLEIADTAAGCDFQVVAGVAAIAEHSIAHQYAAGRPDVGDTGVLKGFAEKIREKLADCSVTAPAIPGNRPYKAAGGGMAPEASSACVTCGLCAAKCPVGAIDKENPKETDKDVCIGCMRCTVVCPQKARSIGKIKLVAVGAALKKVCSARKECELYI